MNQKKIALVLGILCMLLSFGISIQIKTVNSATTGIGKTKTENELRNNVLKMKEKYDNIYQQEEKKETELENLRTEIANKDTNSSELSQELEKVNTLLRL